MIEETGKRAEVKILIAEDELIVAEDLALTLQDLGYQVAGIASTGELAIQLAQESKPTLVLMDIKMAGDIDGIEASEQIRTRLDVPVIFLTAYDEEDVLNRAKRTEPYGYVAKPFSHHILKITIETALYKHAADKRVRESEEKYRLLAENANVGIFTTSLDGAFLQANPAVARMAGYESVEEFLAIRAEELYSNVVDRPRFMNDLLEKGSVKNYEILAQKKDGTPQWVSLNAVIQKDHVGNPASILAIVEDVTDRKEAEKALRESEERYRLLFDNMLDGFAYCKMLFVDGRPQDFVYLHVNEAFERLTDLKNVTGKRVTEVIPGIRESNPELFEIYGRVALAGNPEKFETYIDSLGIWFSISVYSTEREHFIAVFENITDRKQAEEALREREEQNRFLASVIELSAQPFAVGYTDGTLGVFNGAYCNLVGYTKEEMRQIDWNTDLTPPEYRDMESSRLDELVRTGEPVRYEKEYIRKDGTRVAVELLVHLGKDKSGEPEFYYSFLNDITERKRFEERLQEYERVVEGLEEMIVVVDRDYRYVIANRAYLNYRGMEREQLVGRLVPEVLGKEVFDKVVKEKVDECLQGKVVKYELRYKYDKLGERDLLISYLPIEGPAGVDRVACVFQDITERKQAEEAAEGKRGEDPEPLQQLRSRDVQDKA